MQSTNSVYPKLPPNLPTGAVPGVACDVDGAMPQFARTLQQTFAQPGVGIHERLVSTLAAGCLALDMDYGLITHLHEGRLGVIATTQRACVATKPTSKTLPLFMSYQIIKDGAWLLIDSRTSRLQDGQIDLNGTVPERFVGFPLVFDGKVYGTVEFSGSGTGRAFDSIDRVAMYLLSAVLAVPLALLADY